MRKLLHNCIELYMKPRSHGNFIFIAFILPLIATIKTEFGKDSNGTVDQRKNLEFDS